MVKQQQVRMGAEAIRRFRVLVLVFVALFGIGLSAQYAGWTIPEGGKDEKSPLKSQADAMKKGKSLFTSNCQKCHGPEGKGDGPDSDPKEPAADLTDEFRADLNPDGVLYYKIWNGHPPQMPAFKSKLTKEDTWALVEYVKSLRKKS
jgi:mono/diheme cytochrome c family protein